MEENSSQSTQKNSSPTSAANPSPTPQPTPAKPASPTPQPAAASDAASDTPSKQPEAIPTPQPAASTAQTPQPAQPAQPSYCPVCVDHMTRRILWGAMSVYLALMMTVLDGNIVNVALPSMSKHFDIARSTVVWVVNSYQIVIAMLILAFASLGDLKGYKRVFLFGIFFFTLGSAMCSISESFAMLLISRAIEGFGAAAIMSVNIALIRIVYPKKFLSRGMSYNAVIVGAATALGPTLAGLILSVASWHWLFIINIPLGIGAWIIGKKHLPENPLPNDGRKFDRVSAIESALILGIFINLMENFSRNPSHWLVWTQVVIIVVIGFFFIRRQLSMPDPLFPVDLFHNRAFTMASTSSMLNFIATMLAMVSLPFFLKEDLGYGVLSVGLLISPWPIALIVASLISGRLDAKYNSSLLEAIGMAIAAVGLWLLYVEPSDGGFWDIAWRMSICGFGFGLFKTPNNVLIIHSSPLSRSGAAGGVKSVSRQFGQCVGTAMVAIIFRVVAPGTSSRICMLVAVIFALLAMGTSLLSIRSKDNYC